MSWLLIQVITDLDLDKIISFSAAEICAAFNVPEIFIDGKSFGANTTEDAEFEIIEPKQLPSNEILPDRKSGTQTI